ncbi:MAG: S41 family peptidase [Alphaproteobacteria bacterium]
MGRAEAQPDALARLYEAVTARAPAVARVRPLAVVRASCGSDLVCAATALAGVFDGRAALERVPHPDTDTIRGVTWRRSLGALRRLEDGRWLIPLERFERQAEQEVKDALTAVAGVDGASVVLDLRSNRGGPFARMLRVAGVFTGPVNAALYLVRDGERTSQAIPSAGRAGGVKRLTVLVGPETASSAEMLAALLRRYADAEVVGERTAGKDYLHDVLPVDHDWRLLVPAARVEIPGERLGRGLVPDRPLRAPWSAPRAPPRPRRRGRPGVLRVRARRVHGFRP